MPALTYLYELRDGDTVVATGRLTRDEPLVVGDRVTISGRASVVRDLVSTLDPNEQRLILERD